MFIGRSGCGKGTQSRLLKEYLERTTGQKVIHVSTGDQMRTVMRSNNETARLIDKKVMRAGGLAPVFLPIWAWGDIFVKYLSADQHVILDGAPRTELEAKVIIEALQFYGRLRVYPFVLDVSAEEVAQRMSLRGRADDTPGNIQNRMAFYKNHVVPAQDVLKQHYRAWNTFRLLQSDGKSPREVHQEVIAWIGRDFEDVPF
ncbi:MAG: nucleoside monophosphate kinase [Patescibacteria group bacterium]